MQKVLIQLYNKPSKKSTHFAEKIKIFYKYRRNNVRKWKGLHIIFSFLLDIFNNALLACS